LAVGGNAQYGGVVVGGDMGNSSMPFWRRDIKAYKVGVQSASMSAIWAVLACV
jgi:hypothetical protein